MIGFSPTLKKAGKGILHHAFWVCAVVQSSCPVQYSSSVFVYHWKKQLKRLQLGSSSWRDAIG